MSTWLVGTDRPDEAVFRFDNKEAAILFARFDSELTDCTAVVLRMECDGTATLVAEFVR